MAVLADKIGATTSTVNRIEKDEASLVSEWVPALAAAFDVHWHELFEPDEYEFREDAAPFKPPPTHALSGLAVGQNRDLWLVKTDALDAIGLQINDPIIVDISQKAVENIRTGDACVVQFIDPANPLKARTLLRQFVEPDLFITNSRTSNQLPLNRRTQDVRVKGKIEHALSVPRVASRD